MLNLPEWAKKNEQYEPAGGRENFIARSLLRMISILREFRFQSRRNEIKIFSASISILFTIILLILCAASHEKFFLLCVFAFELILLCFLDGVTIRRVLKNSLLMTIFSVMFVLRSIFLSNSSLAIFLPAKTFLTGTALGILTNFFSWNKLTNALAFFKVPAIIIFILDTTLRHIFLLGEISQDMLTSL